MGAEQLLGHILDGVRVSAPPAGGGAAQGARGLGPARPDGARADALLLLLRAAALAAGGPRLDAHLRLPSQPHPHPVLTAALLRRRRPSPCAGVP
eukprot:CAMPEP_0113687140 /NCGR_PEP_ID=MMETSP0038_2-20120614/15743_1 /TAXON_ID=2898 /ORGANISM="Cryptomonas paramecium" /LENGTH=94 /DNA_ID=CAMNT_0000607667 /DNA_START=949 /DNA_END=1230 /DNA_ORIENTATION=+ /assembly_acc=CAM_ASM_000170